ncbi:MAG: hypothetical protein AAFR04_14600, partial [Pseudomonadota bacterium]
VYRRMRKDVSTLRRMLIVAVAAESDFKQANLPALDQDGDKKRCRSKDPNLSVIVVNEGNLRGDTEFVLGGVREAYFRSLK